MLSHIRSLEPTLHNSRIGELFRYRSSLLLTAETSTWKTYRPPVMAPVLTQNPPGWLHFQMFLKYDVSFKFSGFVSCYIASDSSRINTLCTSQLPRRNGATPRRTSSKTTSFSFFNLFNFPPSSTLFLHPHLHPSHSHFPYIPHVLPRISSPFHFPPCRFIVNVLFLNFFPSLFLFIFVIMVSG